MLGHTLHYPQCDDQLRLKSLFYISMFRSFPSMIPYLLYWCWGFEFCFFCFLVFGFFDHSRYTLQSGHIYQVNVSIFTMWENESIMPQVVSTTDAKSSAQQSPFVLYLKKVFGSDKAMILWINLISFSCHTFYLLSSSSLFL